MLLLPEDAASLLPLAPAAGVLAGWSFTALPIGAGAGAGFEATGGVSTADRAVEVDVVSVGTGTLAVDCELASGVPAVDGAEVVASIGVLARASLERAVRDVAFALLADFAAFCSGAGVETDVSVRRVVVFSLGAGLSGSAFSEDVAAGIEVSLLATSVAGAALPGVVVECATAARPTAFPSCLKCWSINTAPPSTPTVITPIATPK